MKKNCILCDIDGVLLDSSKWYKYLPNTDKREDWDKFQTYYYVCEPNFSAIEMAKCLWNYSNTDFILFTAREDTNFLRNMTRIQLAKYSDNFFTINSTKLLMRPLNDFREDSIVKEDMLVNFVLPFYKPILAIDDSINNIEMFKKYNIDTLHYRIGK